MEELDKKLKAEFDNAWGRALDASTDNDFKNEDGSLNESAYLKYKENACKLHCEAVKQAFVANGWIKPTPTAQYGVSHVQMLADEQDRLAGK